MEKIKRPTLHEAWAAMDGALMRMRTVLMVVFGHVPNTGNSSVLTTRELLVVALDDWLEKHAGAVMNADVRLQAIIATKSRLVETADKFDKFVTSGTEHCGVVDLMAVLDFRYVGVWLALSDGSPDQHKLLYDLETGRQVSKPESLPLTSLTCMMSVLLMRVLARVDKMRSDAPPAPNDRPPEGEASVSRPAGAAGS